jgi:protein-S-isoprenylcysteine O-methyltransferase Ste14
MVDATHEPINKTKKLFIIAAVMSSFILLGIMIVFLARSAIITVTLAILMLVGLIGIYVGFGILIAAHVMVRNLD